MEIVGDFAVEREDDPWVNIRYHQRQVHSRMTQVIDSVMETATKCVSGVETANRQPPFDAASPGAQLTVAEAITELASPDQPRPEWDGRPHTLGRREDAVMRCVEALKDHVDAYRLATRTPYSRLTYERLPPIVPTFIAAVPPAIGNRPVLASELKWSGPNLMILEHLNMWDPVPGPPIEGETAGLFEFWLHEIRSGSPLSIARERQVEAVGALKVRGDSVGAVLSASTSSEVLADSVLKFLLWEEGESPVAAADLFQEGGVIGRMRDHLSRRLGGTWTTVGNGVMANWYRQCFQLRHRAIHGGYRPTTAEAEVALRAAERLESFIVDRLADRRNVYKRSALMVIGGGGLAAMGLWKGEIRRFAEGDGRSEPSWSDSFLDWARILQETRLDRLGAS